MDHHCDEVFPDGASTKCPQFYTFEDIQHNLGKLGQRKKVFIWFVPSKHIGDNKTGVLENRIYMFSRHLTTYGFDVKVDLATTVNHASEADWVCWTNREMSQAEWVICVCSQSLYDMFNNATDPTEIHSLNTRATLSQRTLYNRLLNDATLRVIPVILLQEDDNLLFVPPTLRDPKNILHIFENTPFNVKKIDGDLERLICWMAGINRMKLRVAENNHHQGFVQLSSKIPPSTGKNPIQQENFVKGQYGEPKISPPYQPQYNHHPQNTQSHLQHPVISQPQYSQNNHTHQSTRPQMHYKNYQQNIPLQQSAMHYPPTHSEMYHTTHTPRPMAGPATHRPQIHSNSPYVKKQHPPVKNVKNGLPKSKIPADSPILWELSQDVREWKFLGRNLDLEEEMIDEIDYNTIPNKTREKALKVLTEWVNSSTPTWETLGEALMDAEYILLFEKLLDLVEKYARVR